MRYLNDWPDPGSFTFAELEEVNSNGALPEETIETLFAIQKPLFWTLWILDKRMEQIIDLLKGMQKEDPMDKLEKLMKDPEDWMNYRNS